MKMLKRFILACSLAITSCTSPVFAQFNNPGIPAQAAAGAGLSQNGLTISIAAPVPVTLGGTNSISASGTALDNITGFNSTGFLERTGAGAYVFVADPLPVSHGGTGATSQTGALTALLGTSTIPIANGGTNATTQAAALSNILGSSTVPITNGGTNASTATGATANLQYLQSATGGIARSLTSKFSETVSVTDFMSAAQISDTQTGTPTLDIGPAFNSAIAAVWTNGGVVKVPPGVYGDSTTIIQKTGVTIQGSGKGVAIIRALASSSVPVIQTYQFSALTGTNTVGGPYHWGLVNISIDGNRSNRSGVSGVDNIDIYGYDYIISNVESYNAPNQNFYSEWSTSGTVPVSSGGNSMEAHITNLKTFNAGAIGFVFNGPHDSVINGFETYENTSTGAVFGNSANYTAGATYLTNFHSYSNFSNWGLIANCLLYVSNVQSEGNTGGGISVTSPSGVLTGQNVITWGNSGDGLVLDGPPSLISSVTSHNNTGAGVVALQGAQSLSGIASFSNQGNGVTTFTGAFNSSFTNVNSYNNSGLGVYLAGNSSTLTGMNLYGNDGGGLQVIDDMSGSVISGTLGDNTGVQAQFGALGASNIIDANFFTGSVGMSAWNGTLLPPNQLRLNATGQDTRQFTMGLGTMPLYSAAGVVSTSPHAVESAVALSSGSATVTLSGSAVYTSSSSFVCTANDITAAQPVKIVQGSGTSITFTGTAADTIQYSCMGN